MANFIAPVNLDKDRADQGCCEMTWMYLSGRHDKSCLNSLKLKQWCLNASFIGSFSRGNIGASFTKRNAAPQFLAMATFIVMHRPSMKTSDMLISHKFNNNVILHKLMRFMLMNMNKQWQQFCLVLNVYIYLKKQESETLNIADCQQQEASVKTKLASPMIDYSTVKEQIITSTEILIIDIPRGICHFILKQR